MGRPASPFISEGKALVTEEEKEKKELATLEAFFSLLFFSISSSITHAFPLPIKGEAGRPMKGRILTQEHDMSTQLSGK